MANPSNGPIFIVGNQKSGTTLLAALLDSHPDLMVLPLEVKLFYFAPVHTLPPGNLPLDKAARGKTPLRRHIEPEEVKNEIINSYDFRTLRTKGIVDRNISSLSAHMHVDRFFTEIEQRKASHLSDIIEIAFNAWFRAKKVPFPKEIDDYLWVEKTPNQEEYAATLKRFYPSAKFLHVLRDPYANVFSLARNHRFSRLHHVITGAGKMSDLRSEVFGLSAKSFYFLEKNLEEVEDYHLVRFEDIILNTEQVMKEVCAKIGVSFTESVMEPTFCGEPWAGNSRSSRGEFRGIDRKPLDAFKDRISDLEVTLVNRHFDEFMERHGYTRLPDPAPWRSLLPVKNEGLFSYLLNRYFLIRGCL